jgi:dTDP-4-amino-4,6-dideoxygalactose transaminase
LDKAIAILHTMETINVTKTFLPPQEEYLAYLNKAWEKSWLTNNGPLVKELEKRLKAYLGVPEIAYVSSGTIALQIAIKALELKGEIITTPFTYIATTNSIIWEGCTPIFVDIDPKSLNIDPKKIETAITPKTSAILATHVYGNPCDIEAIESVAKKHGLKIIYDAAHCFGVNLKNQSIFHFGDISITSFHATKLFHTIEGGAIFTNSSSVLGEAVRRMRNFGHSGPSNFVNVGINGKNSEFHAAMGLSNLKYVDNIIANRKQITEMYDQFLKSDFQKPTISVNTQYNYAYYPILFENERQLLRAEERLNRKNIFPRRYFYPSINTVSYLGKKQDCPISEDVAKRVLCLPLYFGLKEKSVKIISETVKA